MERCKVARTFVSEIALRLVLMIERFQDAGLRTVLAQGMKSPAMLKLIESLDAFVDHEAAFQE